MYFIPYYLEDLISHETHGPFDGEVKALEYAKNKQIFMYRIHTDTAAAQSSMDAGSFRHVFRSMNNKVESGGK
jgi:hypothetical protein